MILDVFAPFGAHEPNYLYSYDTGDANEGDLGGGQGDPSTTGADAGSGAASASDGMQFSGADAMALGALGVAGAIAAAGAYGGSVAAVAAAYGGLGMYDAEHAGAIGTAMDHAVHDLGTALGNVAAMGDPLGAGLGLFDATSIDAVMASNGGVGAEIADNGAVVMRSANGAYIAAESYNAVYFDHGGTG